MVLIKILNNDPECFIQQCEFCGAVFSYSFQDIKVKNKEFFTYNDENEHIWQMGFDAIICPNCGKVLFAQKINRYLLSLGADEWGNTNHNGR